VYTDWKNTFREKREKKLNRKLTKLQKAIAGGITLAAVTGGSFLIWNNYKSGNLFEPGVHAEKHRKIRSHFRAKNMELLQMRKQKKRRRKRMRNPMIQLIRTAIRVLDRIRRYHQELHWSMTRIRHKI